MLSPSLEDYLEELYRLSLNRQDIRIKDIADCLNVSMPSVVKGLKKLDSLGYIKYKAYEKIDILEKGIKKGKFLIERNKILREFFKIIQSDCDIEKEAEAIEHYLSVSSVEAIEKLVLFLKENEDILDKFKKYKLYSNLKDD
ncbi:iron (metal) dependent repressor, DtxR family [Alkalithermobacter thermoalcaliphilus JW-YL-7 = DSM 7308]|uniref:Iron (Metal) dependent repressor, DtxR family n=1 Tax=Alkalithermobacter thermoalcaliphilus JW-YL-7 = DSM 7308 TaxID=1121328 RepID=A0A150FMJ6_CLOPD|nr:iron (metal) dependent repressor, DtxR family [[Clostridium] paradoxum JW-YL-7 = DSM 7308]SHL21250.1 iron (metal) dependent repressor, DtxR family [[Clostridium] paradoxum JW-YL-7 = DSM 7308]